MSGLGAIELKLEAFEGPFELLLRLIDVNEINIYDIPIAELTDQYLAYVADLPADMDSMSEFALMAATLIEIKSKTLLPKPPKGEDEDESDPRAELVARLIEYKRYRLAAEAFSESRERASLLFYRGAEGLVFVSAPPDLSEVLGGVSPGSLYRAFEDVLARRASREDTIRAGFGEVARDAFSVAEKAAEITAALSRYGEAEFDALFPRSASRGEIIATFLALLELIKARRVTVRQEAAFGAITIAARGGESEGTADGV
ncbi:MAG: segregation/condensation protein A [Clostridiales bacterium]|jgi:segregation and condensation protein A|nr:segregation/condensation protein A [Clostridiales bacterium]